MVEIGKYNELKVLKKVDFGIYLEAGEHEILMPLKYVPEGTEPGDIITAFIYRDSEDRLIATTLKPYAIVDEFAYLQVKDVNSLGAFLDWGLEKDLLVPFREQLQTMEAGRKYVVRIYLDQPSQRIAASAKINKFIQNKDIYLEENDKVDLLISGLTDLGFNAIINNRYLGLLYNNEIFDTLRVGDKTTGYVKKIREDNKIDITLQKSGYEHVSDVKTDVLNILHKNNGFLALGDKSSPEEIYRILKMSKKAYKKVIGSLFKERLIDITDKGIKLVEK